MWLLLTNPFLWQLTHTLWLWCYCNKVMQLLLRLWCRG